MTRREQRAFVSLGPFEVKSLANGTFRIQPAYWSKEWWPKGHTPGSVDGYCDECGAMHIPGVFDRMALAEIIQDLLNDTAGEMWTTLPPTRKK